MYFNLLKTFINLLSYLSLLKSGHDSFYLSQKVISGIKKGGSLSWKLSQWVSSRLDFLNDGISNHLTEGLKEFYENCPCHDFQETKKILTHHFQKPLNEIFDVLNDKPIASGSIGQVYFGIYQGRKVAIKVKHPDINENLEKFCHAVNKVKEYLYKYPYVSNRLINIDLEGVDNYLKSQTNFIKEAESLMKLRGNFLENENFMIPEVYEFNNDFIIMEYLEGMSISTYYQICKETNQKEKYDEIIFKFYLFIRKSILVNNFFHADLHSGNWKINGEKLVIYDAGLVLGCDELRSHYKNIWYSFEMKNIELLTNEIISKIKYSPFSLEILKKELKWELETKTDNTSSTSFGDIRILVNYLNRKNVLMDFDFLAYLLAFNIAMNNFKDFQFTDTGDHKNFYKYSLDRYTKYLEMTDEPVWEELNLEIRNAEDKFISLNREKIREYIKEKEIKLLEIEDVLDNLSDESEGETDCQEEP